MGLLDLIRGTQLSGHSRSATAIDTMGTSNSPPTIAKIAVAHPRHRGKA